MRLLGVEDSVGDAGGHDHATRHKHLLPIKRQLLVVVGREKPVDVLDDLLVGARNNALNGALALDVQPVADLGARRGAEEVRRGAVGVGAAEKHGEGLVAEESGGLEVGQEDECLALELLDGHLLTDVRHNLQSNDRV